MTHKIFSGNDRAKELNLKNYRDLIYFLCAKSCERWNGKIDENATPAYAFIDWGRWAWSCECGNQMYAEPRDPIGFCDQCGNVFTNGSARPVIFPDNVQDIEAALMEREVEGLPQLQEKFGKKLGASQLNLMPQFKPVTLSRDWRPGETVELLREQHGKAKLEKDKMKEDIILTSSEPEKTKTRTRRVK